ncbi:DUF4012 domain-containing protein [Microbacterium dauci]|uniref:DUF4012 domain-containing protein n=1 Tax=Microbacterium dauci TaxID=3048008 RepID=A0ABT6ZE97_9MICO|nr:DUF4012 domain-containing protein [Microbacterium sp. LX3-4]MDJ1114487.1 DUF4012 domain-containing protein [Microbacterium sp. LX3-4]
MSESFDDLVAGSRRDRSGRQRQDERRPRRRVGRIIGWSILAIVVLAIALAVLVGVATTQALSVRENLSSAIPIAQRAQESIISGDADAASAAASELSDAAAQARADADGFAWRTAELVPVVGQNFAAIRVAAEAVDDLATDVVVPFSSFSLSDFQPQDGRLPLDRIEELLPLFSQAIETVGDARSSLAAFDRDTLLFPVASAVDDLDDKLSTLESAVGPAADTVALLPGLMGADGPKTYLLAAQNNAEIRSQGGLIGTVIAIRAEDGRIALADAIPATSFPRGRDEPIVELTGGTADLYGSQLGRYIQDSSVTPDFGVTADVVSAYWQEQTGESSDGVITMDVVALSHMLRATGPVELSNGVEIDADNATQVLLRDAYTWSDDRDIVDLYFAETAGAVFTRLSSGDFDIKGLVEGVTKAVDGRRLAFTSFDEQVAERLEGTSFSGVLPDDNDDRTLIAAYLNDAAEAKLYVYAAVASTTEVSCDAGVTSFTVDIDFENPVTYEKLETLPRYVSLGRFYPRGELVTRFFVYGPQGTTVSAVQVDGGNAKSRTAEDLGRPVAVTTINTPPTESHTVSVTFESEAGASFADVETWVTPMTKRVESTVSGSACG